MKPSLSPEEAKFLRWVIEDDDDVYMTSQQAQQADMMIERGLLTEHPLNLPCSCSHNCPDTVIALVCRHTDLARLSLMCYDIWAKEKGL